MVHTRTVALTDNLALEISDYDGDIDSYWVTIWKDGKIIQRETAVETSNFDRLIRELVDVRLR